MKQSHIFLLFHVACCVFCGLFDYKRNESHDASFFNCVSESSLVFGASAVPFWRINFSLGIHESSEKISVFVVNFVHLILTKMASFLFHGLFFLDRRHKFLVTRNMKHKTNNSIVCNKLRVSNSNIKSK